MFGNLGRVIRRVLEVRRLRRKIRAVPHVALPALVDDTIVRITGTARPSGPVLEAPLSHRTCVYYAILVYEWRPDGSVREVASEHEGIEFALEDGAARVAIDPRQATVSAEFDHTTTWSTRNLQPTAVGELLRRHRIAADGRRTYECCEAVLEVDEAIAAVGAVVRELDPAARPDGGYRDAARGTRFRLVGAPAQPLVISDDPAAR